MAEGIKNVCLQTFLNCWMEQKIAWPKEIEITLFIFSSNSLFPSHPQLMASNGGRYNLITTLSHGPSNNRYFGLMRRNEVMLVRDEGLSQTAGTRDSTFLCLRLKSWIMKYSGSKMKRTRLVCCLLKFIIMNLNLVPMYHRWGIFEWPVQWYHLSLKCMLGPVMLTGVWGYL